jgi:hypothetical protein
VILFFIIHGYSKYYRLIPIGELLTLLSELLVIGILLFWINSRLFGNVKKGGIFTSVILIVILFFGVFQDFFADVEVLSVLSYLRLLIIICIVLFVVIFFLLKKTNRNLQKIIMYLNSLLIIYLLIDVVNIFSQSVRGPGFGAKSFKEFKQIPCDTCKKPSVYLIVMDEYLGSQGLKEYFGYDNGTFERFLTTREFKVIKNPTSNYQLTLFSMASLLNMNYIPNLNELKLDDHFVYNKLLALLRDNSVCGIFQQYGYKVINLSNFEIKNAPGLNSPSELPQKIHLITNQTMISRIRKYLPVWLAELKITRYQHNREIALAKVNDSIINKALVTGSSVNQVPTFVYVHLMMPHLPYVYDSLGRINTSFAEKHLTRQNSDSEYLQYLVYTNRRISQFITELQEVTNEDAIILLMSDHGYRDGARRNFKVAYQTFNAVYLPSHDYGNWYDGISNVNQFRILFNSVFQQKIPLLKDSVVEQVK